VVIRQAVSCDICGTDKKQTNHWFVALDLVSEIRLSGWNSPACTQPGAKHLCGNTCMHRLVDDFMARVLSGRAEQMEVPAEIEAPSPERPFSLQSGLRREMTLAPHGVALPPAEPPRVLERPPRFASRTLRARMLEREMRAAGRLTEIAARRRIR